MYTEEEQIEINKINEMNQIDMCKLWRQAPSGHIYFNKTLPYFDVFENRLFHYFDGFTPQISKSIGF